MSLPNSELEIFMHEQAREPANTVHGSGTRLTIYASLGHLNVLLMAVVIFIKMLKLNVLFLCMMDVIN